MAYTGNTALLQGSLQQPTVLVKNLHQQVTPRASLFSLEQKRTAGNTRLQTVVSAGAVVAYPSSYPRLSEVGRTLLRTTSTGLSSSAEMLQRTLSGKIATAPEDVIQVLLHQPERPTHLTLKTLAVGASNYIGLDVIY